MGCQKLPAINEANRSKAQPRLLPSFNMPKVLSHWKLPPALLLSSSSPSIIIFTIVNQSTRQKHYQNDCVCVCSICTCLKTYPTLSIETNSTNTRTTSLGMCHRNGLSRQSRTSKTKKSETLTQLMYWQAVGGATRLARPTTVSSECNGAARGNHIRKGANK